MRVASVGCTISHAATTVTTANTTRSLFTVRLRCRRVPEFRALTNINEVDIFDFLRPQETRQSEQKEQKSSSNSHDLTAVSICEWKLISIEALQVPDKFSESWQDREKPVYEKTVFRELEYTYCVAARRAFFEPSGEVPTTRRRVEINWVSAEDLDTKPSATFRMASTTIGIS